MLGALHYTLAAHEQAMQRLAFEVLDTLIAAVIRAFWAQKLNPSPDAGAELHCAPESAVTHAVSAIYAHNIPHLELAVLIKLLRWSLGIRMLQRGLEAHGFYRQKVKIE